MAQECNNQKWHLIQNAESSERNLEQNESGVAISDQDIKGVHRI